MSIIYPYIELLNQMSLPSILLKILGILYLEARLACVKDAQDHRQLTVTLVYCTWTLGLW